MLSKKYLKRRYLDLRLGGVTINPIIQASNFVMISYIVISDSIPFWLYAPLFLSAVLICFAGAGLAFRKIQLSTDEDLKYEKQSELNRTLYEIMEQLKKISLAKNVAIDESFWDRLDFVKEISKNKI